MNYIFIDTNIYMNCALASVPDHDLDLIIKLNGVLNASRARLIVPEVIDLEYERKHKDLLARAKQDATKLKSQIRQTLFQRQFAEQRGAALQAIEQVTTQREKNLQETNKLLGSMFRGPHADIIPMTPDLLLRAYRRALRGLKPFGGAPAGSVLDADCVIAESLIGHLGDKSYDRLLVCTENVADFGFQNPGMKDYVLHIDIDSELACKTAFYRSLYDLLEREFAVPIDDAERKRYDHAAMEAELSQYQPAGIRERLGSRRISHPNGKEYEVEFFEEMYVPGPLRQVMPGLSMTPVGEVTYRVHAWVYGDGQYMFDVLSQPYSTGDRERAMLSVRNRIDELLGRDDWADQSLYFAGE